MKVYGKTYNHRDEIYMRMAELNEEIYRYGVSDGRVSEIEGLLDWLILTGNEDTPAQEFIDRCKNFEKEYMQTLKRGYLTAADFQFGIGSRVVGVKQLNGAKVPFRGRISSMGPYLVSVLFDKPLELPGKWMGDLPQMHDGGIFKPSELRHEL